ncbi:MAG: tetratricopeptide repeat protein, partial [Limisphaerales bacterium]
MADPLTTPQSQSSARCTLFMSAALLAITFLIYLPSLHGGKIFDDDIMLNPLVQSPKGLYDIWFKAMTPDYFPLTFSSLWLEYRFWGDNMFGYHVTNVLLHAISAILLWRVLRTMKVPGAWLAAMVFAVHPVNVESVAWISQRKNALAMPFFLATILFYLKSKAQSGNIKYYVLSLVSFALALSSKTAVVPLPVVLLLVDSWQGRDAVATKLTTVSTLKRVAPYFALSLIFGLITLWFQRHRVIGVEEVQTGSMAARLATAGWALWFYLYKTFVPLNLVFVYPRWQILPNHILTWLPLVAFVGIAVAIWRWRKRMRGVVLAFGYFVLMLLPVLGFVSIYYQKFSLVADHWQYFAIIGPIALAAAALVSMVRTQAAINTIAIALSGGLAFLAWQQSHLYQSAEIIWRDTIARNPTCWLAHNSYGLEVMQRALGSSPPDKPLLEEAIAHYQESVRLRPDNVEARINIGSALIALGRVDEGKAEFKRTQEDFPNDALAFYNLGFILQQERKLAEAVAEYRKAIKVWPQYTLAYMWLGRALAQDSKFAEAEEAYSQAVKFLPVSVPA